ncbi:Elongator subunit elp4, partial [Spiromyces aspiralis]
MSKSTSFRRATMSRQVRLPPATRLSTHKAQALISTGVPSLDDILGGGLPVGSILLIEEDRQSEYSRILFSYFISQGIAATHKVCIASAEMGDIKSTLLPKLPGWGGERQGHVSNNNDESGAKAGSPAKDKETGD